MRRCPPGAGIVERLAAGESFINTVPEGDVIFAELPAQVYLFSVEQAGKIHQADVEVFYQDAGVLNAVDTLNQALGSLIVLGLLP